MTALLAMPWAPAVALAQDAPPQPAVLPTPPPAPASPSLEDFASRPVRLITFLNPGSPPTAQPLPLDDELVQLARNQLRLREGAAFDPALATADVARLNGLGRFRTVRSEVRPLADGSVELVYFAVPQPLVTAVSTVGNTLITDQQLASAIDVLVGNAVDRTQLDRAVRAIERQYKEKGYYSARVTLDEAELEQNGVVLFRIREGERTKVTSIRFAGNTRITSAELRGAVTTTESWILDFLALRGQLDPVVLEDDAAAIVRFYRDRGFLDARCAPAVTPSLDGREAIVEFVIEEGPQYTLRSVQTVFDPADAQVFSNEQLAGLLALKPGEVYAEGRVQEALRGLEAAYGNLGYADVRVGRRERRAEDGSATIDLLLSVSEGRRFNTGTISIVGNTITRDRVIRREVQLRPGQPLDASAARETERRLRNTRLFDPGSIKVALQPESQETPGERDVVVEVAETNTGSFNIGVSAGSDGGVSGIFSISQRNFDITDTPDSWGELFGADAFRGGGQTFSITASPGDRVRTFEISLSDPALNDSDYSGSVTLGYRQRLFGAYDETRYGLRFSVGRRLGSLWTISAPVRLENVELSDIDASAPTEYFAASDNRFINSLGIRLERSSVDRNAFPTRGSRIALGVNQYGMLGDDAFTRFEAEYARYFLLEQDVLGRGTTLQLSARAGYIPGADDVAPFYERFFQGGQSFRGFGFRGIGPRGIRNDNGQIARESVGGNWSFFAGAEVVRPIFEDLVGLVGFVDTGTVEKDVGFSQYRASVGAGIRILIPQLGNVPLAFDFGFPVLSEDGDQTRLFSFSIDLPFN